MLIFDKKTKRIQLTRGDILPLTIAATNDDESSYQFQVGDVIRFKVFEADNVENVVIEKDVTATSNDQSVDMDITGDETKIGDYINEPVDYWYEVELNPDTAPQTIIGFELEKGPKIFTLLPEGGKKNDNN